MFELLPHPYKLPNLSIARLKSFPEEIYAISDIFL